ncbi:hypothetical protein COT44_02160 [Candidatus Shapirobacteria bacterium CG08_land_8_20_14_0_20_39_18]|uniref:Uncharacterized protein n=1 Tax=Candidatus Shapirobacteria bacterium CG08_land_8_20_14_0_20_39_18 TaxID=1974883 RepID=A0A2M6XDD6_9BACT|nr:MAG: hypothetical protein COT44_02160 [Candidatus Shapirobacteria bacterium CG08_land_8_20_14_0_20_39_18]PJE68730.1 MAG: hypothetical protein COU94_00575 [Candidatus Shapirobacteria bacterium CG10_big_fil_rev_8_21_14_0_10_38_8]
MGDQGSFTNKALDEAMDQLVAVWVVIFSFVWIFYRNKFNPWNLVQRFLRDLFDGIAGIKG